MGELVLITEGGGHMVDYMIANGVYPHRVVLAPDKFREIAPYLKSEDEVLVVIKGLTDFTLMEIYALLNDLESFRDKLARITVMSNMDLGKISTPYYLYKGDLFYGTVKEVKNGRVLGEVVRLSDEEGTVLYSKDDKVKADSKRLKTKDMKEKSSDNMSINAVMQRYLLYKRHDKEVKVYGNTLKEVDASSASINDESLDKLVWVDLFKS